MPAWTTVGTTFNTTAGSKTFTGTPAANDLIVVVAVTSGLAGGTISVTDNQGGTYTQADVDRTGFSTTGVLTIWVRDSLIPSASSTIFTADQTGSSGGGLTVYRLSGMTLTGASAVRSSGGQDSQGGGTTPAPVLSNTPLSTNPIIGAIGSSSNPASVTPRTGYTESIGVDVGYNTPSTGMESMRLDSGESSATITWGSTSGGAFASVAIELDASAGATPTSLAVGRNRLLTHRLAR